MKNAYAHFFPRFCNVFVRSSLYKWGPWSHKGDVDWVFEHSPSFQWSPVAVRHGCASTVVSLGQTGFDQVKMCLNVWQRPHDGSFPSHWLEFYLCILRSMEWSTHSAPVSRQSELHRWISEYQICIFTSIPMHSSIILYPDQSCFSTFLQT